MDVDQDLDGNFLRKFSCMGTNDKEVLISQLQDLIGKHLLNAQTAQFYLDMTDWNVQAAVGAYFDCQNPSTLPNMTLIKDATIGDGESIPPNTRFTKTWKLKNTGTEIWPCDCHLVLTCGVSYGAPHQIPVQSISPGQEYDLSVNMVSPSEPGNYFSKWRMTTPQGSYFGDAIFVIISVDESGTLALMQDMANLSELGSSQVAPSQNPFRSDSLNLNNSNDEMS